MNLKTVEQPLNKHFLILIGTVILAVLFWLGQFNYLLFHSLAELFSILIAFTIFILTWNARRFLDNGYLAFIGLAFLFIGGIDLLHTLAFRGMGVFAEGSADPPTQLWLAARFTHSISFLIAPFFLTRKFSAQWVVLSFTAVTGLLLASIFVWDIFPVAYVDGVGLTPFKIISEYIIIGIFLAGLLLLVRIRDAFDPTVYRLLFASMLLNMASEFCFTLYGSVSDIMNMLGHYIKIISFYLIYKAIIETGFINPYNLLFRELKQNEVSLLASQEELRKSEALAQARAAQLEAIMDAVPAVVWIANDRNSHLVTGNRASYEFLRLPAHSNQSQSSPGDKVPEHFKIMKDGQDLPPEQQPLNIAAQTGKPVRDFEETVVFDNGETRQLYGNVTPLFDENGKPTGAVAAFIDITERVRAEEALQESERRYRTLFERMAEGFSLIEVQFDDNNQPVDYRILEVNPAYEQLTGMRREQLVGNSIKEMVPNINPNWIEWFGKVASTGEAIRFEDYSALMDKYFEIIAFRFEANQIALLVMDITQRFKDQQALQRTENRLRRFVESNIIGIIYADENGRIQVANDAFLQMVGYTREDLENGMVNWVNMSPPEYLTLDMKGIAEATQRGACTPYEKEFIRKDGSRVPILIGYDYFKESNPPFVSFILDLTNQKRAESRLENYALQLERSNRELQDFAFVASHDLQEPLRKIQAFGDRLKIQMNDKLGKEERDYLERMLSASSRMRTMINDLLALSRVTTRGQPFQMVNLQEVAVEVLSDLEVRIERSAGQVVMGELPTIEADRIQMQQLLQNLIGNALKFHKPDEPPEIKVYSECQGGENVKIFVEDNGVGFEEQYLDRIFQPFQRLHGMGQYEGSGIGLAICRKIAERHSGTITAKSTPGVGSTFIVTLPARQSLRRE